MPSDKIFYTDHHRRWEALCTAIAFHKDSGCVNSSVADITKTAEAFYAFAAMVLTTDRKAPTPQVATEPPNKP